MRKTKLRKGTKVKIKEGPVEPIPGWETGQLVTVKSVYLENEYQHTVLLENDRGMCRYYNVAQLEAYKPIEEPWLPLDLCDKIFIYGTTAVFLLLLASFVYVWIYVVAH